MLRADGTFVANIATCAVTTANDECASAKLASRRFHHPRLFSTTGFTELSRDAACFCRCDHCAGACFAATIFRLIRTPLDARYW